VAAGTRRSAGWGTAWGSISPSREPPSLAPDDTTVLEPGMVLTLEPSLTLPGLGGLARRLMVHEENIVVTATGCELLTRRAPSLLPIV
jgi:Xaa-Pro aminopeptidase